jgi:hypothetical protein
MPIDLENYWNNYNLCIFQVGLTPGIQCTSSLVTKLLYDGQCMKLASRDRS